jgi:hypothetical protein
LSLVVHRLLSLQSAPASVADPAWLQAPVVVLQVSSEHGLLSLQDVVPPYVHTPPLHTSLVVHALPSLQLAALAT